MGTPPQAHEATQVNLTLATSPTSRGGQWSQQRVLIYLGQRQAWVLRAAVQDDTPLTGWLPPGSRAWCAGCSQQVDVMRDWGLGAGSRLEFRLARGPAGRPHPPQDTRASVCLTETRSCNSLFQRAAEWLMREGRQGPGPVLLLDKCSGLGHTSAYVSCGLLGAGGQVPVYLRAPGGQGCAYYSLCAHQRVPDGQMTSNLSLFPALHRRAVHRDHTGLA